MLELLLVLVCIAAISSWAMHHYKIRQRRAQTEQVQSDVKSLQLALDNYFHTTGCAIEGRFTGSFAINCQSLQSGNSVVCSRPPLVTEYQTAILKSQNATAGPNPKPIYRLQVRAVMNTDLLSAGQIAWYQQKLRASANSKSDTLIWESLPSSSYVQLGDGTWVLNASNNFFRSTEIKRSGNLLNAPSAGSFCVN